MFYKPKFCCNCGTGIERVDWRLWTSRRFCDVCEVEQKGQVLLTRLVFGSALLFGVFGVGSYFQGHDPAAGNTKAIVLGDSTRRRAVAMESKQETTRVEPGSFEMEIGRTDLNNVTETGEGPQIAAASKEQPAIRKIASDEPIYFCGAMTKKGKPCSRRVKSDVRCWQHAGQPLAAAARKEPDLF
jgi:hypothetical protein